MDKIGCTYAYDWRMCTINPEEINYVDYVNLDRYKLNIVLYLKVSFSSTRIAAHTGDVVYQRQKSNVSYALRSDIAKSALEELKVSLNGGYRVMYYSGNTDMKCHHTGNFRMFDNANWNGKSAWEEAEDEPYLSQNTGFTVGYITRADNLYFVRVSNSGHTVPIFQPEVAFQLFSQFINGTL